MNKAFSLILTIVSLGMAVGCGSPQYEARIPLALPNGQVMLVRKSVYCNAEGAKVATLQATNPTGPELAGRQRQLALHGCNN